MISVLVPTFGDSPFLPATIASIHAQTYKDFELFVVEDTAGDMVRNWNRCLDLGTGDWVKFVHQDDLLEPTCFERLAASKAEIVACKRDILFANNVHPDSALRFLEKVAKYSIERSYDPMKFAARIVRNPCRNQIGDPSAVMFRRRCISRYGHFNSNLCQIADWEYFARIACNEGIDFINEPLAMFRVHKGSASASARQEDLDREGAIMLLQLCSNSHYAPVREAAIRFGVRLVDSQLISD